MNIVSFSGGKDSTAMLLMMLEKKITVDRVINVDTGKEFPQMYEHIKKVQDYIYPLKIETVKIDFDWWFAAYEKSKSKNKGILGYGWPDFKVRWCTGLKRVAFSMALHGINYDTRKHQKMLKDPEETVRFLGIAVDEPKRLLYENKFVAKYPLAEWGITEEQALQYCYDKGFDWGGLYKKFQRVSCWCCPLSRIRELRTLYNDFPELWRQLEEMDKKSWRNFRSTYSVAELTKKFKRRKFINK